MRLQETLRKAKSEIVNNYYSFRINTTSNPYNILFRREPYKILLILGHMRAGSSLLTHLLTTNPEITGFGETHLQYSSERDFKNLILKVYSRIREPKMNHKYVLDKILHNNKFTEREIPYSEQLYTIFLVREPKRSIPSIIGIKPHWSQEQAFAYYSRRLLMLENYAKTINSKERSFFLTHNQLINNTELVFQSLQKFLGVKQPFSEQYEISSTTGQRGVGDWAGNIKAGRIIRNSQKSESSMSPELIEQGIQAFNQCCHTLSEYCQTIEKH
ncbi:MAG: sulfotransferase family protein [Symploca sp. SIO1C4]|uniref:Sulfotransferase family protein n=1 Tax=Symploca sp. SIO1C4 TaxID=2607765 RepID=A0A6B3N9K9_9CYAN|nr:sulfotransferase family protein [Symploca sp. SIO1C4]